MNLELKVKRLNNLVLREIELEDYLDYYQIGSDPEVVKYLNWGPFTNPLEAKWVIENIFFERVKNGLPKGYAIVVDNRMIGMIDFHTINESEQSIEIGYFLAKEYWGKGIMHRCVAYMTSLAFSEGFQKVVLGSLINNVRSIHLIESLGFHYEYEKMEEIDEGIYFLARYYAKYMNE